MAPTNGELKKLGNGITYVYEASINAWNMQLGATQTIEGIARFATPAEAKAKTLTNVNITPSTLGEVLTSLNLPSGLPVSSLGFLKNNGSGTLSWSNISNATETEAGISRFATTAEAKAKTLTTVSVTPKNIGDVLADLNLSSGFPVSSVGFLKNDGSGTLSWSNIPNATDSAIGISRFATSAEAKAKTLKDVGITPSTLGEVIADLNLSSGFPTNAVGFLKNNGSGTLSWSNISNSTDTAAGIARFATSIEVVQLSSNTVAMTPKGVADATSVILSTVLPVNPKSGQTWYNGNTGKLYKCFWGGASLVWREI